MICKNCEYSYEGKYCPECGQKASVKRFSFLKFLQEGIFRDILQLERGFFYTMRELFLQPGVSMRAYLKGRRKPFFNPIAMLLLMGSLYYIIEGFAVVNLHELSVFQESAEGDFMSDVDAFSKKYQKLFILLGVPASALASLLFFSKAGLNISEHIVVNSYRTSAELLLSVPVLFAAMFTKNEYLLAIIVSIVGIIILGYGFYFFYKLFRPYVEKTIVLTFKSLGTVILVQIVNMGFIFLVSVLLKFLGFL